MFLDEKGKELLEKHLYRNFLLHCCNMHEYNVLSPGQVFTTITQLQRFIRDNNLQHHLNHWEIQMQKAFEQKEPIGAKDNSNLALPSTEVSPNCQRSDFSGIFRKDGNVNLNSSSDNLTHFNLDSSTHLCQSPRPTGPSLSLQAKEANLYQGKELLVKLKQLPKTSLPDNMVGPLLDINTIELNGKEIGRTNSTDPNESSSYKGDNTRNAVKSDTLQANGMFKDKELDNLLSTNSSPASAKSTSHQSPTSKKC